MKIQKVSIKILIPFVILVTPIVLGIILNIPGGGLTIGDESSWVGFFGNYSGGIIGGIVAYLIASNEFIKHNKNDEEKRIISQLNGLIKVRFEVKKITSNLSILNHSRVQYIESISKKTPEEAEEDFQLFPIELDEINEGNWNELDIDNSELFFNLLDLKDFYKNFVQVMKLDSNTLKFKLKEIEVKKKFEEYAGDEDPITQIKNQFTFDNLITDIENELEAFKHKKGLMWDQLKIKGSLYRSDKLLEEIDATIHDIGKLKKERLGESRA